MGSKTSAPNTALELHKKRLYVVSGKSTGV